MLHPGFTKHVCSSPSRLANHELIIFSMFGGVDQEEWVILGWGQGDAPNRGSMSWCGGKRNGVYNRKRGSGLSGCPQQGKTGRNREKRGVLFQTGKTQGISRFSLNTGENTGNFILSVSNSGKIQGVLSSLLSFIWLCLNFFCAFGTFFVLSLSTP